MTNRSNNTWTTSDEWFKEFVESLEQDPKRRGRLHREATTALPIAEELSRAFTEKTEQLRRWLAGRKTA